MIRLIFPNPADSPVARSPLSLRVQTDRNPGTAGGTVRVMFKNRGGDLTAADFAAHRMVGAHIQTSDARTYRQLLEAFGADAPVQMVEPGPSA